MKKITLLALAFVLTLTLYTSTNIFADDTFSSHTVYLDAEGGEYTHSSVDDLAADLADELPTSLLFVGDSTSNDLNEWVYLTSEYFVDELEEYSIVYRQFNNSTLSYDSFIYLETGKDGDAYAELDGSFGTDIKTAHSEDQQITGDIDMAVKIAADDWSDSSIKGLVDKLGDAGDRAYNFYLQDGTAVPHLYYSEDGSTLINVDATEAPTVVDGEAIWFRVTMDVDNGSAGNDVTFYTSTNGTTWTQLGDVVTTAGVTSINTNEVPLRFGQRQGSSQLWSGKFYEAWVKDGIDGQVIASPSMGNIRSGSTFEDVEGNVYSIQGGVEVGYGSPELTILNASVSGKNLAYFSSETIFDEVVTFSPEMTFVSLGHNEGSSLDVQVAYESFLGQITYKYDTNLVLVAQNPQDDPSTAGTIAAHAIRQQQVGVIASENGYGYIDVYDALSADLDTYVATDGIHPTSDGSILWAAEATNFLKGAFGTGVSSYHIEVEDGTVANLPDDPTKTGYVFDGWYTNEALTQEFNEDGSVITEDMTLYAKWSIEGTSSLSGVISAPGETPSLFGIEWYWYAAALVGGGYLYFTQTKKGKKALRKLRK